MQGIGAIRTIHCHIQCVYTIRIIRIGIRCVVARERVQKSGNLFLTFAY